MCMVLIHTALLMIMLLLVIMVLLIYMVLVALVSACLCASIGKSEKKIKMNHK